MMSPPPWRRMIGKTALAIRKGPRKLTPMTRSNCATLKSSTGRIWSIPAQLTATSIRPKWASTASMVPDTTSASLTSQGNATASVPSAVSSSRICPARSARTSRQAIRAPAAANARAVAAPSPLPAPVTNTTFFCNCTSATRCSFTCRGYNRSARRNHSRGGAPMTACTRQATEGHSLEAGIYATHGTAAVFSACQRFPNRRLARYGDDVACRRVRAQTDRLDRESNPAALSRESTDKRPLIPPTRPPFGMVIA